MFRNMILATLIILAPTYVYAQEKVEPISFTVLNEILLDASPSSGAVLRGIQRNGGLADISAALFFPSGIGSVVCLDTVSVDGLYSAQIEYSLNDGVHGLRSIPYSEKEDTFLRNLGASDLALFARPGRCAPLGLRAGRSDATPIDATVAYWRANPARGPIELLVNTLDATTVRVRLPGHTAPPDACRPVTAMLRSAYNLICTLSLPDESSPLMVELIPYRGSEPGRSLWVRVHLPVEG